jgi:hypothetical protein
MASRHRDTTSYKAASACERCYVSGVNWSETERFLADRVRKVAEGLPVVRLCHSTQETKVHLKSAKIGLAMESRGSVIALFLVGALLGALVPKVA